MTGPSTRSATARDRFEEPTEYRRRAPHGRADLPAVGVFADRGPRRPNRIGVSICRIVSVRGRRLNSSGGQGQAIPAASAVIACVVLFRYRRTWRVSSTRGALWPCQL